MQSRRPALDAPEWRIPPRRATTAFPRAQPRLYRQHGSYDRRTPPTPREASTPHRPRATRLVDGKGHKRPLLEAEKLALAALTRTAQTTTQVMDATGLPRRTVSYALESLARRHLAVAARQSDARGPHGYILSWRLP